MSNNYNVNKKLFKNAQVFTFHPENVFAYLLWNTHKISYFFIFG